MDFGPNAGNKTSQDMTNVVSRKVNHSHKVSMIMEVLWQSQICQLIKSYSTPHKQLRQRLRLWISPISEKLPSK